MSANPLPASTSSETHSRHLELCILSHAVGLYPSSPANITSDELAELSMSTGPPSRSTIPFSLTRLLSGPLDDFLLYANQEHSKWLMDISHDICDPALKRGSLKVWDEAGERWRDVAPSDPLTTSTYLYVIWAVVSLTKFSERAGISETSEFGNPAIMVKNVKLRDGFECWVTGSQYPTVNGHVCPKRMGDHLLRVVYSAFVSNPPPPALSIYDEICGITLNPVIDYLFGKYQLGLRFVAPDVYECHVFPPRDWPQDRRLTIFGSGPNVPASIPLLHGRRACAPQPQHARNPPPGLIRWHYLQCVIRKLAHSDYKKLKNIFYCELPLRMEDDNYGDNYEDPDDEDEPEWPTAALDHGRAMQVAIEDRQASGRAVAEWVTGV